MFAVKKPPQAAAHSGVFCLRTDVLENLSCLRQDQTFAKLGDFGRDIQHGMRIEGFAMKKYIDEMKNDCRWWMHLRILNVLDDMCCTKQSDPTVRMKSTIC